MSNAPLRSPPTPGQVIAQQKLDAAKLRQQNGGVPAAVKTSLPATAGTDNRSLVEQYVDSVAPSTIAGQLVKFNKGLFVVSETGDELGPDDDYTALCDETLVGWIRFNGEGVPPDRHQGLLYRGFQMPARESLGDLDPSTWPEGLDGKPSDPWQHQQCLVLQSAATQSLYTFTTSSDTGRRAVGNLLKHYNRMERRGLDAYPVVRLKQSGFNHKDARVGWVPTPSFVVFGQTPKSSAVKPDTSIEADMNDQIPW
jgi:hypothetical protein